MTTESPFKPGQEVYLMTGYSAPHYQFTRRTIRKVHKNGQITLEPLITEVNPQRWSEADIPKYKSIPPASYLPFWVADRVTKYYTSRMERVVEICDESKRYMERLQADEKRKHLQRDLEVKFQRMFSERTVSVEDLQALKEVADKYATTG